MHTVLYQLTSTPRILSRLILFAAVNIASERSIFLLLYEHARHLQSFLKHLLLSVYVTELWQ